MATEQNFLDYSGLEYYHQKNVALMDDKDAVISYKVDTLSSDVAYISTESDDVAGTSTILTTQNIVDNLDSSLNTMALSAKQGKVLNERINTFTTLPEGSTTGDAELADIRIDVGGTTHTTAGDAVRSQINKLNSEIAEVKNDLDIYTPKLESGVYNATNGNKATLAGYHRSVDKFNKKTNCINVNNNCSCICFDENDNFLRTTTSLVQGNIRRIYLTDDVKRVAFNIENQYLENFTFKFIEYDNPFSYSEVNYFSINKTPIKKAFLYKFDYLIWNIAFYGMDALNISDNDGLVYCATIDNTTPAFFNSVFNESVNSFIIPIEADGCYLFHARFGKPYNTAPKVCCYGTSITDVTTVGKYPYYLRGLMECESTKFDIKGIAGGTYKTEIKNLIIADTEDYDIIFMEGVANDWYKNISYNELEDAVYDICQSVIPRCKKAYFVVDHMSRPFSSFNLGGKVKNEIGYYIREYFLKVAEMFSKYGVTVLDVGGKCGINEFEPKYYVDQIHHSDLGGEVFAKEIYKQYLLTI